jgi:hypothetical protein
MTHGAGRFYCRALFVCLLIVGGSVGCRSTESGALRAGEIEKKVTKAQAVLNDPNATPGERKAASELLTEVAKDSRTLGSDFDREKKRADDNAAAASKWRWAVGLGLSAGVAFFIFRRRR